MKKYKIIGTFEVIFEDDDEENAVMQCMDNYLCALKNDYDEYFKSVTFGYLHSEEINND